eukprot:2084326-Amphidinium_carterae.1
MLGSACSMTKPYNKCKQRIQTSSLSDNQSNAARYSKLLLTYRNLGRLLGWQTFAHVMSHNVLHQATTKVLACVSQLLTLNTSQPRSTKRNTVQALNNLGVGNLNRNRSRTASNHVKTDCNLDWSQRQTFWDSVRVKL